MYNPHLPSNAPKRSPWGTVDYAKELAPGVFTVSTPGHGGIKLDRKRNAAVPKPVRRKGGWYEEDCEYALAVLVHPEAFDEKTVEAAHDSAKNWYPEAYETLTGTKVKTEESYTLRKRAVEEATKDKFVVRSARGDWAEDVPTGKVCVTAQKASTGETADFLVTAAEYADRPNVGGFVVDETKHTAC